MESIFRKLRFILEFVLLLVFIFACSSKVALDSINGGFENSFDDTGNLDGWTSNQMPQTVKHAHLKVDDSVSHSGRKSVSIFISKTPQTNTVYNWVRKVEGLKPGYVYELSGWIKTFEIKNSPFIELKCWNAENKMLGSVTTEKLFALTGTKNWRQVKTLFKIPEGTTKVLIVAGIESSQNSGSQVWFDDIVISLVK